MRLDKPKTKRKPGDFDNYEQVAGTDEWTCKTCKGPIMAVEQRCPVWDGPFPMSGSGRVRTVQAPYCPNCEEEPDDRGLPILEGPGRIANR